MPVTACRGVTICRGAEQGEDVDPLEAFEEALSVLDVRELAFLEPER